MALRLADNPINRALAERQAKVIEADLAADALTPGAFDQTLAKYRDTDATQSLSLVKLWDRYVEHKRKTPQGRQRLPRPRLPFLLGLHRNFLSWKDPLNQ